MKFWQNVKNTLTNIKFKGRSCRKEYIHFTIFELLFSFIIGLFVFIPLFALIFKITVFSSSAGAVLPSKFNFNNAPLALYLYCIISIIIYALLNIWIFIASITLTVRRFHDLNYSGWVYFFIWLFSTIIPFVLKSENISRGISLILGLGLLIVQTCIKGTEGTNKYGESVIKITNDVNAQ